METKEVTQAEQQLFNLTFNYLEEVGKLIGVTRAIWSADIPYNWSEIAFAGRKILRDRWAENDDATSVVMTDPTWTDLWEACDALICSSGDYDHCYVESFSEDGDLIHVFFGS